MTPRPSGLCRLAILGLCLLGACASPSQSVKTSKEQGDSSTAVDQQVQQSGIFNFAKTTTSALMSGGSVLFAMMTLFYMNYRAHGELVKGLIDVIQRIIPLVNREDSP